MKRKRLRKSDIRELNESIQCYGYKAGKKDNVEIVEDDGLKLISINNRPMFFYHQDKIIPTLKSLLDCADIFNAIKKAVVDMGAVKFVTSGADIMRPGIVETDEGIKKGDAIAIIDVDNRKPLAVGIAMFSSEEIPEMKSGKVVKSIHYVGDNIWGFSV